MNDAEAIDLEEFKQLRAEIVNRTTLGNQVISYAITALAAGVAVSEKFPEALLGVAVIVNFFWLMWLDHTGQVFKVASYIGVELAPRLQRLGDGMLGWEQFMRRLDASGRVAATALYGTRGDEKSGDVRIVGTRATSAYIGIVFGASTPVLVTIYLLALSTPAILLSGNYYGYARLVLMASTLCLWVFSVRRAWLLRVMTDCLDDAILSAQSQPRPH